ncbi:MAG TPA: hypothetical protein ENO01_03200, partial [Candidatus Marinimicrobia bacterium]|nr:hypothetical protein [Candidatus Neomarinimicrobiota bacterium]
MTEIKRNIQAAIQSFTQGDNAENALALFTVLGYNTSRRNPFQEKSFSTFEENYLGGDSRFNQEKACVDDWQYVDLLFQLSKSELSDVNDLFDTGQVDQTIIETYLFFVIELSGESYTRTALSQITREINKVFPMPVMVLFKYQEHLTLSVINRRLHKRDSSKDVLEKVTLIKDIHIQNPHRAHIEILYDLSIQELQRVYKISNFVELHNAWQKTLDTKELNKRFYRELSNWYFWAIDNVSFPNDVDDDKDDTVFNAESVIRLLTRLIFIWFIKEKSLVPEPIFNQREVGKILKNFNEPNSTVYYRAILQNLFFATLNQTREARAFADEGSYTQNREHFGMKNVFRYAAEFNIPKEEVIRMFDSVPFLNGGLFDCLDSDKIYLDGFSRNPRKQARVPDYLFFSEEQSIDLSGVYADKKKKREKVKGLFNIFDHYKFTITENTPIEEEVALDPELLGRVFENLLASYNPETKTTARKQTGSFYTPREIVNYMVDESLKAYLKEILLSKTGMEPQDAEDGLDVLLGYNEKGNVFNSEQTANLIVAIDRCKILDPACGSGAFPMGILHKLVHILDKLDPGNGYWRQIQKDRAVEETKAAFNIGDKNEREERLKEINEIFENNSDDYGRKLFLIENCIYGVDIQPIAIQISKLRFFISLIVDQIVYKDKDNFGIRALPNLETKFVAANTLIGLEKPVAQKNLFENQEIAKAEDELKELRHRYFGANTRREKLAYQKVDKELREKISHLLVHDGWLQESARQIVEFDPYNQNKSSPFFDPEWMFGITEGFDIVIGNPPYVQLQKDSGKLAGLYQNSGYQTFIKTGDIYCLFYEAGFGLLKKLGIHTFITSSQWMKAAYGKPLRKYILELNPLQLMMLGPGVFDNATVDTNILIAQNTIYQQQLKGTVIKDIEDIHNLKKEDFIDLTFLSETPWVIINPLKQSIKTKIETLGKPL